MQDDIIYPFSNKKDKTPAVDDTQDIDQTKVDLDVVGSTVEPSASSANEKRAFEKPQRVKTGPKTHSFWKWELTKKQWALWGGGLIIFLVLAFFGGKYLYAKIRKLPPQPKQATVTKAIPKPTTEASKLTGVQVDPALNKRPITGIMIENSPDARPQSGIKDAGVVFEAIAEGGITRFLTLFQEAQPDYIGPVRSARPYYLDWALGFDASLAHAGGSPTALALIKSIPVKDLDEFANAGAYERVSNRYAPHNLYTSSAKLSDLEKAKGFTSVNFTPLKRKPKEQPSAAPSARVIDISISGPLYNTHYDYDKPTNSYLRSEAGQPHKDERSKAQISPKVVVAMVMSRGIASDGQHTNYGTIGSGNAFVFEDGNVQTGKWKKADQKSQITLTDNNGKEILLNAGQTWFTVVDADSAVSFKP